jgi:hypothetical protein
MMRNEITNVFLGEIANRLGNSFSNNIYQDPFTAYYDDLEYSEGFKLMEDFKIITDAYGLDDKDYYENITSTVVDRLLAEDLKYGIYLTGDTYFSYTINDDNQASIKMDGNLSSVMIINPTTRFAQTGQTVSGSTSRLQFAFDSLEYIITKGGQYDVGQVEPQEQEEYEFEEEEVLSNTELKELGIILLQNPVKSKLSINNSSAKDFKIRIYSIDGKSHFEGILKNGRLNEFYVGYLHDNRYILSVTDIVDNKKYLINILKTN